MLNENTDITHLSDDVYADVGGQDDLPAHSPGIFQLKLLLCTDFGDLFRII